MYMDKIGQSHHSSLIDWAATSVLPLVTQTSFDSIHPNKMIISRSPAAYSICSTLSTAIPAYRKNLSEEAFTVIKVELALVYIFVNSYTCL